MLLVGPPASGKSTLARHLVAMGAVDEDGILSADELRRELLGDARDISAERAVFAELRRRLVPRLAEGRTTVVDATNLWPRRRARHLRVARQHGRAVVALVVSAPLEDLLARNARRPQPVPPGGIVQMHRQAASITDEVLLDEGCALVVRVGSGGSRSP